jgi:hypothetical protein
LNEPSDFEIKLLTQGQPDELQGEIFICVTSSIQLRHGHRAGRPTAGIGPEPTNHLNFTALKHNTCHFAGRFQRFAIANVIPDSFTTRRSRYLSRGQLDLGGTGRALRGRANGYFAKRKANVNCDLHNKKNGMGSFFCKNGELAVGIISA